MISEVIKDMSKEFVRDIMRIVGHGSKIVTYPILGGLPETISEKLEDLIGKEYFNSTNAEIANLNLSPFLYIGATYLATSNDLALGGACLYGFIEWIARVKGNIDGDKTFSMPLAIITAPITYIVQLYERAKD